MNSSSQISCIHIALLCVSFIVVNSYPTHKNSKPFLPSRIAKQERHEFFNSWKNDLALRRSRRFIKSALSKLFKTPTATMRVILVSRTSNILAVFPNGTVCGISDSNSPYALLELQTYNSTIKRIYAITAKLYIGMDKNGRIRTTKRKKSYTVWTEKHEENAWYSYQSQYLIGRGYNTSRWFLSVKKNGRLKNGNVTTVGMDSSQFVYKQM